MIASPAGPLFLEVLDAHRLDLHNDCNGQLKCGKCRIIFLSEAPEILPGDRRHLSADALEAGTRLACIHQIEGDCRIELPAVEVGELLDDL